ncbi:hypothetical protein UlMin_035734 [Ulmus minor]
MALSSSTATLYIPNKIIPLPTTKNGFISFSSTKLRRFHVRSSDDPTSVETPSIDVPEGPPSLISALNVERALRGIPITDVDHYGNLGVSKGCSIEQVRNAYKSKSEELMKQGLEAEELDKELQLLKESYTILSTDQERRLYDWSLARSEKPDRYLWPFEVDQTKPPQEEPPAQEPEDVGPTRAVGYFILGWVVLSVVLSIALNR